MTESPKEIRQQRQDEVDFWEAENEVIRVRGALVRIATLYLKIPKDVVTKYLKPQEWKELVACYNQCRPLVPAQGNMKFEEPK